MYNNNFSDIDHRITFDNVVKGSVCDSNSQPPPSSPLFLITETPLLSCVQCPNSCPSPLAFSILNSFNVMVINDTLLQIISMTAFYWKPFNQARMTMLVWERKKK